MAWLRGAALMGACLLPLHVAAAPPPSMLPSTQSVLTQPALTIESNSTCPSSSAIGTALARRLPPARWPSGTVRVQTLAGTLIVDLISDGISQRQVGVTADCALRATTVALIIATWTGKLTSDAAAAPTIRPPAASPPAVAPVRHAPPPPPISGQATSSYAPERELGAGLLLALWDGLAPGVRIDFVQTRAPRGLGWQMGLALPARRERSANNVATSWTRAAVSIALNGRIDLGRLAVSIDAGGAGSYTIVSGQGFSIDQSGQALTAGLAAGLRMAIQPRDGWAG